MPMQQLQQQQARTQIILLKGTHCNSDGIFKNDMSTDSGNFLKPINTNSSCSSHSHPPKAGAVGYATTKIVKATSCPNPKLAIKQNEALAASKYVAAHLKEGHITQDNLNKNCDRIAGAGTVVGIGLETLRVDGSSKLFVKATSRNRKKPN